MKTMQFIGLPWGSAPQGISISAPFPDKAQHLPQGALWQQVRARLLFQVDRKGYKHREISLYSSLEPGGRHCPQVQPCVYTQLLTQKPHNQSGTSQSYGTTGLKHSKRKRTKMK